MTREAPNRTTTAQSSSFWHRLGSSSAHGVGHVVDSSRPLAVRICWAVLVVAALVALVLFSTVQIIEYYERDTVVSISERSAPSDAVFPAVTLCNLNRFNASMISADGHPLKPTLMGQPAEAHSLGDQILASTQLSHLLLACTFEGDKNGGPCEQSEWSHFVDRQFGNCYTWHPTPTVVSSQIGSDSGLQLLLNLETYDYAGVTATLRNNHNTLSSAGIVVVVHTQHSPPEPSQQGFVVAPGTASWVGFQRRVTARLSSPYGKCITAATPDAPYSVPRCEVDCVSQQLLSRCGCLSESHAAAASGDASEPLCFAVLSNHTAAQCISGVELEFLRGTICNGVCLDPCDEVSYDVRVSAGAFPVRASLPTLQAAWGPLWTLDFARENLVQLRVFPTSTLEVVVQHQPAMTPLDLLGSIGGMMGLFAGFSVLTFCEVLAAAAAAWCHRPVTSARRTASARRWRLVTTLLTPTVKAGNRGDDAHLVASGSTSPKVVPLPQRL